MYKVIIAGGREFDDYRLLKAKLDLLFKNKIKKEIIIVSGGARGADALGERYAKEKGLQLSRKPANWKLFRSQAGFVRNREMAEMADACVCFWDGQSSGTKHMIDLANEYNLDLRIVSYSKKLRSKPLQINGITNVKTEETVNLNHLLTIQVVHCRVDTECEYIGRPNPLGNPYTQKHGTKADFIVESREAAVQAYEEYILAEIKQGNAAVIKEFKRLKNLALKGDLKIGCWCHPKACHGDVVKKILERSIKVSKV